MKSQVLYQSKSGIARTFDISRSTVYRYFDEIREQIKRGRYNSYAILDNKISVAVFADYLKYRKLLKDKYARRYVPDFNMSDSIKYLQMEVE